MKKTIVIGSTVADIIIKIPHVPTSGEDVNITSQQQQLGGCAYNVSHILRMTNTPHILCSPVGSGIYGDFVAKELQKAGIQPFVRMEDVPNGCCYCIVDDAGERTFLSKHGAEYMFRKEWMKGMEQEKIDSVYFCGLELEEPTGEEIVLFLEENPSLMKFFAPGPRIEKIPQNLMKRIFKLNPIIHLNHREASNYTGLKSMEKAAQRLHSLTGNIVVVTLGKKGAYCVENGTSYIVPGIPAKIDDTIGAGDAHFGAIIASIKYGLTLKQAVQRANMVSAAVVSVKGSLITKEQFDKACKPFKTNQ